jgi:hypothetical protein
MTDTTTKATFKGYIIARSGAGQSVGLEELKQMKELINELYPNGGWEETLEWVKQTKELINDCNNKRSNDG